jgi:hypothetical protein
MEPAIHCLPTSNAALRHLNLRQKVYSALAQTWYVVGPLPSGVARFTFAFAMRWIFPTEPPVNAKRDGFQNLVNKHLSH